MEVEQIYQLLIQLGPDVMLILGTLASALMFKRKADRLLTSLRGDIDIKKLNAQLSELLNHTYELEAENKKLIKENKELKTGVREE